MTKIDKYVNKSLTEEFRDDTKAHRAIILFEFFSRKPIFECYKTICERLGDDFMEYNRYEFWFMRFARGEFDLNYDRRTELEHPHLLDLPNELLDKVIGILEPHERLPVRRVCQRFQELTDAKTPKLESIQVNSFCEMQYDDQSLTYSGKQGKETSIWYEWIGDSTCVKNGDPKNVLMEDLTSILKHPECDLPLMVFNVIDTLAFKNIIEYLKRKNLMGKVLVRNLCVKQGWSASFLSELIPIFRWETLESIIFDIPNAIDYVNTYLEAYWFPTATMLKFSYETAAWFSERKFMKCSKFTITFTKQEITVPLALDLVRILLLSDSLQLCYLEGNGALNQVEVMSRLGDRTRIPNVLHRPNALHYTVPGSGLQFNVEVYEKSIRIERQ